MARKNASKSHTAGFRRIAVAALLATAGATFAVARPTTAEVGLEVRGSPYLPYASEAYGELPIGPLVTIGIVKDLSVRAWYDAGTPYLVPGSFFEAGASVRWNLGGFDQAPFVAGLGTAFSMAGDAVSVPLVVELEGRYRPTPWLTVNPRARGLVYGEGFIAGVGIRNLISPFPFGLGLSLGADVNFAYSDAEMIRALTWGLSAGLAYDFRE